MTPSKLIEASKRFRALKDRKDALATETKEVNAELAQLETEIIPSLMDENEIETFKVDGVGTIFQQVKLYVSVKGDNQDVLHDWLRAKGHEDMIRNTVAPSTLKVFIQDLLEQGEDVPDFVSAYKVPTAMLRRGK